MAKTRFFQHLNENSSDFQKVTTLDFIENAGGMVMYYFKDGSKCNKMFIAPINAETAKGFEFAEVSDPGNVWKLKKIVPDLSQEKPKPIKGDDGVLYEAPDWDADLADGKRAKTHVDIIGKPLPIEGYQAPNDSDYYFDPAIYKNESKAEPKKSFNFNDSTTTSKTVVNNPQKITDMADETSEYYHIDINHILNSSKVILHFPDGKTCEMNPSEFIENAITPKEEKVVEKVVEKEVVVTSSDTDIDLGVDNTQKTLIDNMINMSNKVDYSFDMEMTLNLPPISVYKLIKSVYPEGMDRGFVNILANRMQIKELKTAVANALLLFYDEDIADEEDTQTEETTSEIKTTVKKATRTKKDTIK